MAVALQAGAPRAACAQSLAADAPASQSAPYPTELSPIVVSSRRLDDTRWKANKDLDEARDDHLLPKLGASAYEIDQAALQSLPQGKNTPMDKLLLQIPGVSYDSAISNPDFHIRNEYSNAQFRINGIQLPDGVSALGPVLETGLIGNLSLLDGTLPAQYGLRTAGVIDIRTKDELDSGGNLDFYGGSWATASPSIEYAGNAGRTQYFLTGRYLQSEQGLENATPMSNPIHDRTTQEKYFGYGSTLIGDSSRLTYMSGGFVGRFQIPDVNGQAPLGNFGPTTLPSSSLNERETDRFFFAVAALQTHHDTVDTQLSFSTRYAAVDFLPDLYGDLAFNDVASNVMRQSLANGLEYDASDRFSEAHTLRTGVTASVEQTRVRDLATVLPLGANGDPLPTPVTLNDYTPKTGWTAGGYIQDEWRISPSVTLNTGLRFDQMNQFVSANQFSPRIALLFSPAADTTLHAGVSRYFTPPMQAQATPNDMPLFKNTTQQAAIPLDAPAQPERATYFDLGVDRKLLSGLTFGLDVYYKRSTDTLDDGQFGQAVVLDEFNYARGFSRGAEFKINYMQGGLRAYANVSGEISKVKSVVSHQYLIGDPVEFDYLARNYTYASDAQTITASAGTSYRWRSLFASIDGIYGSGLREGFANEQHTPAYTQWNGAVARYFDPWHDPRKPLTLRLSIINLFDRSYLLRGENGVGEFAPQYGPRRGVFAEVNQAF